MATVSAGVFCDGLYMPQHIAGGRPAAHEGEWSRTAQGITGMAGPGHLEAVLLERSARGDQEAFESLFHRFERPLYAYFVRMIQDAPTAEELVCETMAAVWRGAGGFRGESQVSTWIFGIAHRLAARAIRRRRPVSSLDEVADVAAADDLHEAAEREDVAARVRRAVATLPPDHREVVELTFYHGFSYPEIAKVLGIPVNTVKTRMFYAREKLRGALERVGVTDAH